MGPTPTPLLVAGARFLNFVLLLFAFLLTFSPLTAHADCQTVVVRDASDARWEASIRDTIDQFNAVMPAGGPVLVYERTTDVTCGTPEPKEIEVCSGPTAPHMAWTVWSPKTDYGDITLTSDREEVIGAKDVVCHEFMHAVAHVTDNYGSREDSCVWGYLNAPGTFDIWLLDQRFGDGASPPPTDSHKKHKKHKKDHHKHHGPNHHHHS